MLLYSSRPHKLGLRPFSDRAVCRHAVAGVPWCLRKLSLVSTCSSNIFDKQITTGQAC